MGDGCVCRGAGPPLGAAVVPAWLQHLCAVWDVAAGWQQENAGIHWGPLYWEKWAEEKGWSLWKPPTTVPGITHPRDAAKPTAMAGRCHLGPGWVLSAVTS